MNSIKVKLAKQITFIALISLLSSSLLSAQGCGPVIGEKSGRVIETGKCNSDGQRYGEWTSYNDNNLKDEIRLKAKGNYANGKKHGIWKYYDKYGPYILKEATYNFGILSGPYTDYYDTGNKNRWMKSKGEYKNGKREGQWTDFWDNSCYRLEGPPKEIAFYKEGIKNGESLTFYDSNCYPKEALASRGFYNNGKKDGEWKYYNNEGNEDQHLIKKFNFKKGAMSGSHYLYKNGSITKSFDYTAEPSDEGEATFNEAGQLIRKDYEDYYLTFYEQDGNTPPLKSKIEKADDGTWLFYYDSGELEEERTALNATTYYKSGRVKITTNYSPENRGEKVGIRQWYYENGVTESLIYYNFSRDLRLITNFYPNGKIETVFTRRYNKDYPAIVPFSWWFYDDGSIESYYISRNKKSKKKEYKKGKKFPETPAKWEEYVANRANQAYLDYVKKVIQKSN